MARWMVGGLALAATGCTGGVGNPAWTEDLAIDGVSDQNNPDSFGTKMCVTESGGSAVIYVIWLDDRLNGDEQMDIWMNVSTGLGEKGTWLEAPIKVNAGNPDVESNIWNPDLFCNELGAFVVWEDDRDGVLQNHQIYFNRTIDQGKTFMEEDLVLENDPDGMSMSLEPKITGYGENLYVAWYDSLNGAYDILVATSSNGGTQWRAPTRVDSDDPAGSAYSARPEIAVSDSGDDVWVVWEDSRDGKADIYFARSDNGGTTFKEDERLDEGEDEGLSDSFEPTICTDGVGQLYAVWHDSRNGAGRDIYFNYSGDKGDNWLVTAQRLEGSASAPGFGNSLFPKCVSDGGVAHVAWYDQLLPEQGYDIWYAKIDGGIPSGDPLRIDAGWPDAGEPEGYANSLDPRVALGADVVAVAWSDYRGEATAEEPSGYNDLYYNFSEDGGASFQDTDLRIDSMFTGTSFKKDLNFEIVGGSWFAAWTDGRGGTQDIYFESMAIGEQADPPSLEDMQEGQQ